MGNHTVDDEKKGFIEGPATDRKKEFIERPSTKKDSITTNVVAWQNNQPQKLEVEVTNGKETTNLPFMIENGDIVSNSDVEVSIKAKGVSRDGFKEMKAQIEKSKNKEVGR